MNPDKKFNDIIEDITYKANLTFQVIETNLGATPSDEDVRRWKENSSLPSPLLPLGKFEWRRNLIQEKIFTSQYHFDYGHCLTLDISALSKNEGKFPIEHENKKVNLMVVHFNRDALFDPKKYDLSGYQKQFFLHNGTDIGLLGQDITGDKILGGYLQVHFVKLTNSKH